jgi:hypothetical protein
VITIVIKTSTAYSKYEKGIRVKKELKSIKLELKFIGEHMIDVDAILSERKNLRKPNYNPKIFM